MKSHLKMLIIIGLIILLAGATLFIIKQNHPKRYAVFAGYNADATIHPYVISYLKGLNEVTDGVVYIADSGLSPKEAEKLKDLTIHYENKRHGEYDFGSYKRGYEWLKKNGYLDNADELIFANDSTYAPMKSFKPMFAAMEKRPELDFWGDLQNTRFVPHVQSYFMVFRRRVIQSKLFNDFISSVEKQVHNSLYILKYEVNLTPTLAKAGYKWDSYMPYKKMSDLELEDKNSYPLTLLSKYNHQFLKRRTFTTDLEIREDKGELLKYIEQNYPERHKEIMAEVFPHGKDKK